MDKNISVITVGMNHLEYLKALYESLDKAAAIPPVVERKERYELIYVDNCSTDDSVNYIREHYPQVKILQNLKPLGFGENNNKGILASKGEYIAIINPDIVVREDSLTLLRDYLKAHPDVGIVAPQLLNPDGTVQYSARGFVNLKRLCARALTHGNDAADNKDINEYLCKNIDFESTQPVDWAIGAAYMLRRDTYAMLGGFDQDYFLYMEDEDICYRTWRMGMQVVYHPKSKMTHNHIRASSKVGRKMWLHIKSMATFMRKHGLNAKR